jgi:hypothetical protein
VIDRVAPFGPCGRPAPNRVGERYVGFCIGGIGRCTDISGGMDWYIIAGIAAGVLLLVWMLLELRTSRPDGTFVKVHPYRRMLMFALPTRNESVVYFDDYIRAEPLLEYLEEAKSFGANLTHATVAACMVGVSENPRMNQFSVGRRLFRRNNIQISFSMKRQKMNKEARLAAVKMEHKPGETFKGLVERVNGQINVQRSGKKTYTDKEFNLFEVIPRPMLRFAITFLKGLDYYGLLPYSFIENDAMYTSVFVANLGSVGMGAGYHHLYEWGTCPLFVMFGQVDERPVVQDGQVVVGKVLHVRFSYDERIDDGLTARYGIEAVHRALENPRTYLGCLAADGSDARALDHVDS